MQTKDTILIADDNEVNRRLLHQILCRDYQLLQAANGQEVLDLLGRHQGEIAGIVLDLIMPVLDGYGVLQQISLRPDCSNIPILVATADDSGEVENRCLELGAWDFVRKPYDPGTVRLRLQNIINRSQRHLMARLRHVAEHDGLTDLYNREKFFQASRKMMDACPGIKFAFVRFDIDRFRLINSFFGETEGNRLLQFIANKMREFAIGFPHVTYGRMEADVFCFCEAYDEQHFLELVKLTQQELRNFSTRYYAEPSFGVYVLDDPTIKVETMYARAAMAAERCKGSHLQNYAFYDSTISEELFRTQSILNDMDAALDQRQFVVYLQPKYDLRSERPYGAEALVRWQHPEKGLIQPADFIPVFEHNGFISKVDYYVWEEVCRLLRRWIDAGENPAPISVNVSRMNMYNPHLVDVLRELVERYGVPPALLNLELTESAYMDNPESMKKTLHKLHEAGFIVLMDDFGSGYSSLNTLRDIAVDILKIDMKFLPAGTTDGRSERILTSVIRMAGWLGIPVVVEGVETAQQRDFLKSVGCGYIQGYFYARPMPVAEYEALLRSGEQAEPPLPMTEESRTLLEGIWREDAQRDIILRHIPQPLLVCEVMGEESEVLRVNQAYLTVMRQYHEVVSLQKLCEKYIPSEFWTPLHSALHQTIARKETQTVEYRRAVTGGFLWLRAQVQYLYEMPNSHLVFVALTDVTKEKELEAELKLLRP